MEYKDTLLMLQTEFEMRGNLPKKEPLYLERWKQMDLYKKVTQVNKGNTKYIFHDGPPYANGNIHIGHALDKTLKDIIFRQKMMRGYDITYIPGWDTHGLPIETAIQKQGVNRKEISTIEFRKKCEVYAHEQVKNQAAQMIRLGTLADYDNPYLTLHKEYESREIEIFAKMALKGLIYKGLKPVYWSYSSETALAEAEIEYHDKKSPAIYVAFKVVDGKGVVPEGASFVIWTTTPWTIPANLAISVHPDLEYVLIQSNKGQFVWLKNLSEQLVNELELENVEVLKAFKGHEFELIQTKHPLYDRQSVVILGDHVTEEGTGSVHTAPGHGVDDFNVGNKYNLDVYSVVDAKGYMVESTGPFAGLHIDEANKAVVQALEEVGALLKFNFITHSYPHDWRTKKPIIFRATDQWFASIDAIRNDLLNEIDQVKWHNEWGHVRIYNMIRDRGDWCISRQRVWGVPIPIIYCEDQHPIVEKEVFDHFVELFKQHGSNIWFELDAKDLLPKGYTNVHSPNGLFTKETDTMDVWFDSGTSHTGVLVERGIGYPADLYFEGSDQYRGWFNSSLITGVAAYGKAPYKSVLSHGFVMDAKGNKMSKSQGNSLDPIKVVNQMGADILRLWVSTVDYTQDVRISDELLKQVAEMYRKIRNTTRFMLGNLYRFNADNMVAVDELDGVDQYMMIQLKELHNACLEHYEAFEFSSVMKKISNYMSIDLSSFYLDYAKDILFVEKENAKRRRQVQTVLHYHVDFITKLIAPVLPFLAEEVYDHFTSKEKEESVFFERYEDVPTVSNEKEVKALYEKMIELRDDVLKGLEQERNQKTIHENSGALVTIVLNENYIELAQLENHLRQLFKVGSVKIISNADETFTQYQSAQIKVEKFEAVKCERCWNLYLETEMADEHICKRCAEVLKDEA